MESTARRNREFPERHWSEKMDNHAHVIKENMDKLDNMYSAMFSVQEAFKYFKAQMNGEQTVMEKCSRLEDTFRQNSQDLFSAMEMLDRKVDILLRPDTRRKDVFSVDTIQIVRDNNYVQVGHNILPSIIDHVIPQGPSRHSASGVQTVIRPDGRKEISFTQPDPVGDISTPQIVRGSLPVPRHGRLRMAPEWESTLWVDPAMIEPM